MESSNNKKISSQQRAEKTYEFFKKVAGKYNNPRLARCEDTGIYSAWLSLSDESIREIGLTIIK